MVSLQQLVGEFGRTGSTILIPREGGIGVPDLIGKDEGTDSPFFIIIIIIFLWF